MRCKPLVSAEPTQLRDRDTSPDVDIVSDDECACRHASFHPTLEDSHWNSDQVARHSEAYL